MSLFISPFDFILILKTPFTFYSSLFTLLRLRLATLIRALLIFVVTPLTGFLQRVDVHPYSAYVRAGRNPLKKAFCEAIISSLQFLNWSCQGMLTLGYPSMGYDPIESRRQAAASQWASAILKIPSGTLEKEAEQFLETVASAPPALASESMASPSFTILICFYHHLAYFKNCLDSIARACAKTPEADVEILITNDDPSIDEARLLKKIPEALREKITLYSNKKNLGICRGTNEAIKRARGTWILHLDCDDQVMPNIFEVLTKKIRQAPNVRFISSRAIDIDERENILLWRLRAEEPRDLIKNNVASHLKAVRKDIHQEIGFFNSIFEGCQDYEFALRAAIYEPLNFIPEYLYRYRWHSKSQTVGQSARQNLTAMRVRQTYLLAIFWMKHGTPHISWKISGPYADSWIPKMISENNREPSLVSREVFLEALQPYSECLWKLLLVQVSTLFIDHCRTNSFQEAIRITL